MSVPPVQSVLEKCSSKAFECETHFVFIKVARISHRLLSRGKVSSTPDRIATGWIGEGRATFRHHARQAEKSVSHSNRDTSCFV